MNCQRCYTYPVSFRLNSKGGELFVSPVVVSDSTCHACEGTSVMYRHPQNDFIEKGCVNFLNLYRKKLFCRDNLSIEKSSIEKSSKGTNNERDISLIDKSSVVKKTNLT